LRRTVRAAGGRLAIGSDPSCDVHLPDPKLLKHQASLALDDTGNWWLEVQDPSVPTCLNRAVQKARAQLKHEPGLLPADWQPDGREKAIRATSPFSREASQESISLMSGRVAGQG